MMITVLKSKLAYVKITQAELLYEGSITIDEDWMDASGIRHNEQVHVVNVQNGERLVTYAIRGERGSRTICLNGPAARKGLVGDEVIVLAYTHIEFSEQFEPMVVNFLESHD